MIKIFTILMMIIIGFSVEVSAQTTAVKGIVIDKARSEPLVGASIALYLPNDSTIVQGTVTGENGVFRLTNVPKGNYSITVSFIGFIPYKIESLSVEGNMDLGTINLEATNILMDAVTITGEKAILTNTLEKKIYNVEQDVLSESGSVSDMLQSIPSVSVDLNGNVTLRNSGNITFFINGRPSAMLRRNAAAVLEQMSASSIERIEVITNPSAKYRPDGIGGIINIVMKKETGEGLNGQIGANIGTENRYNGNGSLNYGTHKLKLYSNYGIRHSEGTILYTDDRLIKSNYSQYNERGDSKIDALSHTVSAGINYDLSANNNFEISANYFLQNSFHKGISNIFSFDSSQDPVYNFTDTQTNDEFEGEGEVNFNYEHKFKNNEDHTLTVEATYSAFAESEDLNFQQNYTIPSNLTELSSNLIQKSGNQEEIKLDYTLPVNEETDFESGYLGEFIFEDISYNKDASANRFLFNQDMYSVYAIFGHSIESFNFKAGLRGELTSTKSHLTIPTDSLIQNQYLKIYPTLHFGYALNNNDRLSLSYSKRVNRPDADELNPNPEFTDPRNAESGNPNLKPEQIHSLELGYQTVGEKLILTNSLYSRYKYDAFTNIQNSIADTILINTVANLKTQNAFGLETVLSGSIEEWWDFDLTGNIFYTTIDAANLGYSSSKSTVSGNIKGYLLLKLWANTAVQLNAFYYFPSITPQGERSPYYYFNVGVKRQLFDKRLSITLSATDVLHTYKIKRSIDSIELNQTTMIKRRLPVIYLGFAWRFNNHEEKQDHQYEGEGLRK